MRPALWNCLRPRAGVQAKLPRMNAFRLTLAALACSVPLMAAAQWQWLDKDGRKVFSDQPPPPNLCSCTSGEPTSCSSSGDQPPERYVST